MKKNDIIKLLNEDFHLDALGRMVIKNEELLSAINGAMCETSILDTFGNNSACINGAC